MNVLVAALALGAYSGVDADTLLDTPILVKRVLYEAGVPALLTTGRGMSGAVILGRKMALTEVGFSLEIKADLPAGHVRLEVEAFAPGVGSDSYFVSLDGQRLPGLLLPPRGRIGKAYLTLAIAEAGTHRVGMTLREAPGSAIGSVVLSQLVVESPFPPMRGELRSLHPRLFFTAADIPSLRTRLSHPMVEAYYALPSPLTREPSAYRPGKRNGGRFRTLGNWALGYLLDPNEEQLAVLIRWLEMATTYGDVGADLDAEYFMQGLALTYDWLYDELPDPLRREVRSTIADKCRVIYSASLAGKTGGGLAFQQNHYWFAHLALALGAAAIVGEEPEAEQWLAWVWDRFERIALTFSPDGSFHEGPAYWNYSMPTLYVFTDLYEWCTGKRIPAADKGLRGQGVFRTHHLLPGTRRSAPLEDTKTTQGAPPVDLLLWEASRYRDPVTMGLAREFLSGPSSSCFRLLWLDETVPGAEQALAKLPTAAYYRDVETVFARTSSNVGATFVAFVCRPLGGWRWAELCSRYDLGGTGHNHPAQNHFVLFGRGEVLAGDPGYTYEKKTRNHNTVLVDGQGQYGDGEMWPRPTPGRAHITAFASAGDITITVGEAASAYPKELGLAQFERALVLAQGSGGRP